MRAFLEASQNGAALIRAWNEIKEAEHTVIYHDKLASFDVARSMHRAMEIRDREGGRELGQTNFVSLSPLPLIKVYEDSDLRDNYSTL